MILLLLVTLYYSFNFGNIATINRLVTLDAIALNCILSLMMIQKSTGTKRNWKWLLGSLHEERLRRDSSEQLSIKKMTRQVHLSLCYICRKRRTGLRAVILILRLVSKGKNNLTLATTVEKLTIRKMSRNHGRSSKMKKITTPSNRACILYLGCTSFSTIELILRGIMTHFHFLTIPRLILESKWQLLIPYLGQERWWVVTWRT